MVQETSKGLQNHEKDNVATVFGSGASRGMRVEVTNPEGVVTSHTVGEDIPFGHKIAIAPIARGERVMKYGEAIGIASKDIAPGEYVHVHNVESARGRGDWKK